MASGMFTGMPAQSSSKSTAKPARKKKKTSAGVAPKRPKKAETKPTRATRSQPARTPPAGRPTMSVKPTTIDEYLDHVDGETRQLLERLRRTIHRLEPTVEECISYAMPAFRYRGKVIAGFAATSQGASYYPFSGTTLGTLASALKGMSQTKSGLHFTKEKPLSEELVRQLLEARKAEL